MSFSCFARALNISKGWRKFLLDVKLNEWGSFSCATLEFDLFSLELNCHHSCDPLDDFCMERRVSAIELEFLETQHVKFMPHPPSSRRCCVKLPS